MTLNRSVVTMVLILATIIILVHAKDATTLEYENLLPANETNTRHRVDTDSSIGDHRQGRVSLQAEQPSSKAKREQALRSILAARRRQILSQRPIESRNLNRTPRPVDAKDPPDVLEAQETRHGMYVTAPAGGKADEDLSSRIIPSELSSKDVDAEFVSRVSAEKQARPSNDNPTVPSDANKPVDIKSNYTTDDENSPPSLSSTTPVNQNTPKSSDTDIRRKNIVSMPESLYNYFRPVESNIPVEDMSQFLYFGQKIQPESQNTTGNNSVDATPRTPIAPSSRRRYSVKRFGATTPVPVPRLEEMVNEEMNIAVERQTVEKNKMSKIRNAFRSPENGVYYRRSRPTETMVVSNVIGTNKNASGNATEAETDVAGDKFPDDNPSAHADRLDQLRGGSPATHVAVETRNASNSTQIPFQRPVSANAYERPGTESEISPRDRTPDNASLSGTDSSALHVEKTESHSSTRASGTESDLVDAETVSELSDTDPSGATEAEMYGASTEKKIRRIEVHDVTDGLEVSSQSNDMQTDERRATVPRASNNIESSTPGQTVTRSTTEPIRIAWTSPETSTLRIIVTEGSLDDRFSIEEDTTARYTVKPVDSAEERVRNLPSGDVPTPSVIAESPSPTSSEPPAITTSAVAVIRSKSRHREQKQQQRTTADGNKAEVDEGNRDPHRHRLQEEQQQRQRQQHVYAYTITNVTRLLRNYTGPGLSREEQGGPERSTGTTEITTGSAQRRQPPPPSLLLPRAGSGIEGGRAPVELSAGTTVEAVAAGGVFDTHLVGERQRKVVAVALPQSQQRAVNEASPLQLISVNKSGPRTGKTTELNERGAVRWNHTRVRNLDLKEEGFGDRKILRKSASAVLNQRIGAGPEEQATSSVADKRRRINGQTGSSYRRIKGSSNIVEESAVNAPTFVGEKENFGREKAVEDASEGRGLMGTAKFDVDRPTEDTVLENMTAETATMLQRIMSTTIPSAPFGDDAIVSTTPRMFLDPREEDGSNSTEAVNSPSGNAEDDAKDKSTRWRSENETISVGGSNGNDTSVADNGTRSGSGSPTVTVTAAVDETIVPKEVTVTPIAAPVFPVTPRIIAEAARPPTEKETFTSKPTEIADQITDSRTTESDKPFGMANLEPSEIQKMYRSRNTSKSVATDATTSSAAAELPTTTLMTTAQIEISTIQQDQSVTTEVGIVKPETFADPPATEPGKQLSAERSLDVKGRNLSEKSQDSSSDKDDVLPIMHLYNTSDIFNGTGPVNSLGRGTERRVELPVNSKPKNSRTTERLDETIASKGSTNETSNSPRVPETTRKDKHEDSRETAAQVPPTGPGRGASNGSGNNRMRHRPVYHPAILPEYNTSVYPDELNGTFFEPGLISVSPRESVNISEVISKRHDGDAIASQETVAVVSYILATLVVFPIAVGVGLILRRLILRNRKVLEESDTSSEISCRKDALHLENGDFKTSIEKAITKLPRIQHLCHEAEKPPPPSSQESRWEFPRDKLRLQTVLGQGNFGQVWKAEADDLTGHQGTTRLVAVKTVKEGSSDREKEDLVRELEIMQQLGNHPNVVTLLGCCTEQEPHYLILEYVMYGKLLAYLRDHRTRQDFYNFSEDSAALTSRDLTVFGYCVARGMEYLASKKIIHRDLAARNVLVDHNKLCKIADFGMSRFANEDGEVIETRHGRNALPIRWMAPESLIYSLFTTKTDVWSFGILMWEIVTLGSTPYPDMTAREVMRNVQNGYRLERPSHCRSELFRVISRCWHADPDRRPEFQTLRRDLAQLLEDNMNGHYVDLESFASECTD